MNCFDESTFQGRFNKYLELTNVKHLFHSKAALQKCKESVENGSDTSDKNLRMYAACIHPNTKEIIPAYGRVAFFVPINIPICAGMLLSRPTLPNLIGWQWFNQTYNAVFNYSNSAKSGKASPGSFKDIPKPLLYSYLGSAGVSVSLAVGLSEWVKKGRFNPKLKPLMHMVVPFFATASAGVANVGLMRSHELKEGIPVTSLDNLYLGHSKIAAKRALFETALSRAALPIPFLLAPAPFMAGLSRLSIIRSSYIRMKFMQLFVLLPFIGLGLPAALGLYPQYSTVPANQLEPMIAQVLEDNLAQSGSRDLKYNKGI